jgi:hypothetical protein
MFTTNHQKTAKATTLTLVCGVIPDVLAKTVVDYCEDELKQPFELRDLDSAGWRVTLKFGMGFQLPFLLEFPFELLPYMSKIHITREETMCSKEPCVCGICAYGGYCADLSDAYVYTQEPFFASLIAEWQQTCLSSVHDNFITALQERCHIFKAFHNKEFDEYVSEDEDSELELLAEPLAEPLTEPLAEPLEEPLAEPLAEPLGEPLAEPLEELLKLPL